MGRQGQIKKLLDEFGEDGEKASAYVFGWVACIILLCSAQINSASCEQAMKIMIQRIMIWQWPLTTIKFLPFTIIHMG